MSSCGHPCQGPPAQRGAGVPQGDASANARRALLRAMTVILSFRGICGGELPRYRHRTCQTARTVHCGYSVDGALRPTRRPRRDDIIDIARAAHRLPGSPRGLLSHTPRSFPRWRRIRRIPGPRAVLGPASGSSERADLRKFRGVRHRSPNLIRYHGRSIPVRRRNRRQLATTRIRSQRLGRRRAPQLNLIRIICHPGSSVPPSPVAWPTGGHCVTGVGLCGSCSTD